MYLFAIIIAVLLRKVKALGCVLLDIKKFEEILRFLLQFLKSMVYFMLENYPLHKATLWEET